MLICASNNSHLEQNLPEPVLSRCFLRKKELLESKPPVLEALPTNACPEAPPTNAVLRICCREVDLYGGRVKPHSAAEGVFRAASWRCGPDCSYFPHLCYFPAVLAQRRVEAAEENVINAALTLRRLWFSSYSYIFTIKCCKYERLFTIFTPKRGQCSSRCSRCFILRCERRTEEESPWRTGWENSTSELLSSCSPIGFRSVCSVRVRRCGISLVCLVASIFKAA